MQDSMVMSSCIASGLSAPRPRTVCTRVRTRTHFQQQAIYSSVRRVYAQLVEPEAQYCKKKASVGIQILDLRLFFYAKINSFFISSSFFVSELHVNKKHLQMGRVKRNNFKHILEKIIIVTLRSKGRAFFNQLVRMFSRNMNEGLCTCLQLSCDP